MDRHLLGRTKRALALFTQVALVSTWLTAPRAVSTAFAQGAPVPPTPPAPSAPGPAPTPAQLADAKKFFEAGLKLYKEQLFHEALASFVEANRISPRESIQRNIAQTYREMKDMPSAHAAFEELVARYGATMKPQAKADAQRAIEELEILTGLITLKVQEPGAKVTMDGKEVGTTPIAKPVRAGIGVHTLIVSKPGFETLTKYVTIRGHDAVSVDDPFEKDTPTGHVTVTILQPDPTARIFVDSKDAGVSPLQVDLEPGVHTIEARGATSFSPPKQVEVAKRGKYDVALELRLAQGSVSIQTGTPDAEITVDANVVGRGAWEGALAVGKHDISASKGGFEAYKTSVLVHMGERITENVRLVPTAKTGPVVPEHDWTGVYVQLNLVGNFPVSTPSNEVAQVRDLPAATVAKGGFGGGINVRAGHSFGIIGIEGIILGAYDHSSAEVAYRAGDATSTHPGATPRKESYAFHRFGGTAGVGVRLMPKTQLVRPTLGVGAGVSFKAASYRREATGGSDGENAYGSDFATYVAPALMIDGGIELGNTPGVRFYLGALLFAEFASSAAATAAPIPEGTPVPTRPLDLAVGTDIFIGPVIGMQFGE